VLSTALRILDEAEALRAAFPDVTAMLALPISVLPPEPHAEKSIRTALGYLRDEMLLVRAGRVEELTVLDDEIACVRKLVRGYRDQSCY
jgi:hypothetical protein